MQKDNSQVIDLRRHADDGEPALAQLSSALLAIHAFAADASNWADLLGTLEALDEAGLADQDILGAHLDAAADAAPRLQGSQLGDVLWVELDASGRIGSTSPNAADRLETLCERAGPQGALRWRDAENQQRLAEARKRVQRTGHRVRLYLRDGEAVVPGFLGYARDVPEGMGPGDSEPDALILMLADPTDHGPAQAVQFGLTPAEDRLAAKLVEGMSLKQAAAELGVAHATARNQLRSIFARVGVNRQPELVRVLLQSSQLDRALENAVRRAPLADELVTMRRERITLDDGRRLAWRAYGDERGRPVLYFHNGLGVTCFGRRDVHAMAEHGLRVITFDRPGFGESDPCRGYSPASVVDDALRLLDELGIDRAALFGFAAGGPFALSLALRAPERISRVAWAAPRPETTDGPADLYALAARFPTLVRSYWRIVGAGLNFSIAQSILERMFSEKSLDSAFARRYRRRILSATMDGAGSGLGVADDMLSLVNACPIDIRELAVPLMLWCGEHDSLTSSEAVERYAAGCPAATVRTIAGVGHANFHQGLPEVFADLAANP